MSTRSRYWAVIPAAGVGRRMQADKPKQYIEILGKTILEHTVQSFISHPQIAKVVVVVGADDPYWPELSIASDKKVIQAVGGEERCHSVLNGLSALNEHANVNDWVLVHDAARPCIDKHVIDHLMQQIAEHPVGGILAYPVRDTIKRSDANGQIAETIDRNSLWHAMTPQMFRVGALQSALQFVHDKGKVVTDEAQAMEFLSVKPLLITAPAYTNKVTQMGDLLNAEQYLQTLRHT